MKVNVKELKSLSEKLLSHIERNGLTEIEIGVEYYWDISKDQRYSPYEEPKEHTLGQLTEDWKELEKILYGGSPEIGYGLVWLSQVLRAIGEKTVD